MSIDDLQQRIDEVVSTYGAPFRASWYPHQYAEAFLREHPEVLGEDDLIHHLETLDRYDSFMPVVEELAGRLGADAEDLLARFADARLKENGIVVDSTTLREARY